MSKTTDYIVEVMNNTQRKYKIVLIVEEDDSMTLPQEVRQRVLADGFDSEEEAVEEMNYIIDDYVEAHG
tara:strand:+ start:113 stop:319 length:207 start_codon:yes stop_codon:yes gene_type:complete